MEVRTLLSKDQAIGVAIFLVCVVVAIFYVATLFYPGWLELLGLKVAEVDVRFWVVAVPVFIAFIAIMGIGAWIGWTMATTPPPKPIEEVTSESEEKREKVSSE
jgi:predicted DNA-binding transcriptional regulator